MTDLSVESVENSGAGDTGSDDGAFSLDSMRLQLDQFEGPFEVLLYLIKKQEIDIFDIPILQVTR
ncbi:MAG TPA: hypothetical protein PLZ53_10925, partial [Candidatus Hydrogenedentes bacterium]|nr:hypothetical protein [Candidatus Hydrogenedentota bacterium]